MKNKKGFSLTEILIVISIIVLIASLSVVSLRQAKVKARVGRAIKDFEHLKAVLNIYFVDYNNYPQNLSQLQDAGLISYIPSDPFQPKQEYRYYTLENVEIEKFTDWAICSNGPDEDQDISNYSDADIEQNIYSPKNGTWSNGDVIVRSP